MIVYKRKDNNKKSAVKTTDISFMKVQDYILKCGPELFY